MWSPKWNRPPSDMEEEGCNILKKCLKGVQLVKEEGRERRVKMEEREGTILK